MSSIGAPGSPGRDSAPNVSRETACALGTGQRSLRQCQRPRKLIYDTQSNDERIILIALDASLGQLKSAHTRAKGERLMRAAAATRDARHAPRIGVWQWQRDVTRSSKMTGQVLPVDGGLQDAFLR